MSEERKAVLIDIWIRGSSLPFTIEAPAATDTTSEPGWTIIREGDVVWRFRQSDILAQRTVFK